MRESISGSETLRPDVQEKEFVDAMQLLEPHFGDKTTHAHRLGFAHIESHLHFTEDGNYAVLGVQYDYSSRMPGEEPGEQEDTGQINDPSVTYTIKVKDRIEHNGVGLVRIHGIDIISEPALLSDERFTSVPIEEYSTEGPDGELQKAEEDEVSMKKLGLEVSEPSTIMEVIDTQAKLRAFFGSEQTHADRMQILQGVAKTFGIELDDNSPED